MFKGLGEFQENTLKTGGMNVTGLQLVNLRSPTIKRFVEDWQKNSANPTLHAIRETRVKDMTVKRAVLSETIALSKLLLT